MKRHFQNLALHRNRGAAVPVGVDANVKSGVTGPELRGEQVRDMESHQSCREVLRVRSDRFLMSSRRLKSSH